MHLISLQQIIISPELNVGFTSNQTANSSLSVVCCFKKNIKLDHGGPFGVNEGPRGFPEAWQSTTMTMNVFHDVMRILIMFLLEKVNSPL